MTVTMERHGQGRDTSPRPGPGAPDRHPDPGGSGGDGPGGSGGGGDVRGLPELLAGAGRILEAAVCSARRAVRLSDAEVTSALGAIDGLSLRLEQILLQLVTESDLRGLAAESGLSVRDWLTRRCPWLSPAQVGDAVTVAGGLDDPDHEPIRAAIAAGELPLRRAARVLRALDKVRPVCSPQMYREDVDLVLRIATRPHHTDRDLTRVIDRLISAALDEKELEAKDRAARELRGVNESSLAGGDLTRFVVICDSAGAGLIRSVLASPLAAPAPDTEGRDPRTATQRRYDALITILGRGVGAPTGSPTTAKARLVVTVSMDALTGALKGAGHTLTGDQLSPSAVRTLACNADLIPVIFGKEGEVLETVRPTRYATETQLITLHQRDRGCTFPGCTIPPEWCDAHHITWWSRGGPTALTNLALLCGRHHTIVHQRDLSAEVDRHGVTWHL